MFASFAEKQGTPHDVRRFEQFWFMAVFLSAMVAIEAYDYTVATIGRYPALLTNVAFFGASIILVGYVSRRRSNIARLLTLPFLLLIVLYDLSLFFAEMTDSIGYTFGTLGRLGLMVVAIHFLFTPQSRAWFAGKPGMQED